MPRFHKDFSSSAEQSDKYFLGKDGCFKVSNSTQTCQVCCGEVFNFVSSTMFATHFALLFDQRQTMSKAALVEACKDLRMR